MKHSRIILKHIVIIVVLIGYAFILDVTEIGCPIRALTGVPCPTCGTTRALQAFLSLDFAAYWYYQPAMPLIVAGILLGVHNRTLAKRYSRRILNILLILIALIIVAVYLYRIIFLSIP